MPLYDFQSPDGEIISLLLDTKQTAEAYRVQVQNGKTYKRVYHVPNVAFNSQPRDATSNDYRRLTENKNLTLDEMAKVSKDLSDKRAARDGRDEVKENYHKRYEKDMGQKHSDVIKKETAAAKQKRLEKSKQKLKKFGVTVEL